MFLNKNISASYFVLPVLRFSPYFVLPVLRFSPYFVLVRTSFYLYFVLVRTSFYLFNCQQELILPCRGQISFSANPNSSYSSGSTFSRNVLK